MFKSNFFNNSVLLSIAVLGLSACESTGVIEGVSGGEVVRMEYQQGFMDSDGKLSLTMPSGERFEGKFIQASEVSEGDEIRIGESSRDDVWVLGDSTQRSSSAKALLLGDRGRNMKCQFQFASARWGIEDGGIGECRVSDGETVEVVF
ncbi:hypothetical protein [uncultured Pseudoteredinibacter sp.]|uniref:hypothetical protein n=1 Tax=uncultured Pseudoteredinibacter sp. TaxID=1641701 RepID=UPI00260A2E94|nr:hypothetical protein [uncultured Pseudoteredinibacter sp.]